MREKTVYRYIVKAEKKSSHGERTENRSIFRSNESVDFVYVEKKRFLSAQNEMKKRMISLKRLSTCGASLKQSTFFLTNKQV